MLRPVSHPFFRYLTIGLVAVAILFAALAARLAMGPMSVSIVNPFVERALDASMKDYRVRISDAIVRWAGEENRVNLRFDTVRLLDRNGAVITTVPEMEVALSLSALARGLVAPAEVSIFGPTATLVRQRDGRIQLGFAETEEHDERSTAFFDGLVKALRRAPTQGDRLSYLNRFSIRNAALTFYDAKTGSVWRAPHARMTLARTTDGAVATLDARVGEKGKPMTLNASASFARTSDQATITLRFDGLTPARLATRDGTLRALAGMETPMRGEALLALSPEGHVSEGRFSVFVEPGRFIVPGLPSVVLALRAAEARGVYRPGSDTIVLEQLSYDAGTNRGSVTGEAKLTRGGAGHVRAVSFNLEVRDVALDMPEVFSEPGRIDHVGVKADLDLDARVLMLNDVAVRTGDARFDFRGRIDDTPEGTAADINGTIENLALADFARLWPIGPAHGARDWIVANVPKGVINNGVLKITAAPGELKGPKLADSVVNLTFDYRDLELRYIRGLTPITNASGHANLTGNTFTLTMDDGRIADLVVSDGTFFIGDLALRRGPSDIALRVRGPAPSLLAVLDMPPLGYPTRFGIAPDRVKGTVDGMLKAVVPLKRDLKFADVTLAADVGVQQFVVPAIYRDFGIDGGTARFRVDNDGLNATGDVIAGGYPAQIAWREDFKPETEISTRVTLETRLDAPGRARAAIPLDSYLQGMTPVSVALEGRGTKVRRVTLDGDLTPARALLPELGWSKEPGEAGRVRFALDLADGNALDFQKLDISGPGLAIKGNVTLGPGGTLLAATLDPVRAGPDNQARLSAKRDSAGALKARLEGEALDLSGLVERWRQDMESPTPAAEGADKPVTRTPFALEARLNRLTLAHDVVLTGLDARFAQNTHDLTEVALRAGYATGGTLRASLAPGGIGERFLTVNSDDAGRLMAGLSITDRVKGGTLKLLARLPEAPQTGKAEPANGRLTVEGFRVMRMPILAKLLTVGSLGGMSDLLNGEGIAFERLEAPFTLSASKVTLGAARAYGPAVGITMEGAVPRGAGAGSLDLKGTLVPAYTLNTFLGYVPMLGPLLVSRKGEGVIGYTYAISGAPEDPRVFVNPLSALAPGFLRRIFQIGDANTAQREGEPKAGTPE